MANPMRLLIADDEAPARARLARLLAGIEGCELCGQAATGMEALELAAQHKPDIVLLDVRMPGMDGLETARHLGGLEPPPAVIFTTAYDEYALRAFDSGAVDYLVKPIRAQRLADALARAARPTRAQLQEAAVGAQSPRQHVSGTARGKLELVPVADVICFVAESKYTCVRHTGGELLIEESLKSLESEFAGRFVRIHRNALVALDRVASLEQDADGAKLVLHDGQGELKISRRNLATLKKKLKGTGP